MPGLPSASFRSTLERFEEYNEVRHKKLNREENRFSHLGPGSYDPKVDSLSVFSRGSNAKIHAEKTKKDVMNYISPAPPVGSYNIQRDMSPISFAHVLNSSSRNETSSFRSCGRDKPLMGCAKVYMTLREDLKTSNRGPGMYLNITPSFGGRVSYNPTLADPRHRAHLTSTNSSESTIGNLDCGSSRKSRSRLSDTWRPSTSATKAATEKKMASAMRALDTHSIIPAAELKRNIDQVRNLPDYPL